MEGQFADKFIDGYSTLTHRQYGKYFKDWMVFAHENNFDYMQPMVIHAINFISRISGQCQEKVAVFSLVVLPEYEHVFHTKLVSTLNKAE